MRAVGRLVDAPDAPGLRMRRVILSELGSRLEMRTMPAFAKASFRALSWSPDGARPATSEPAVVGTAEIDDLKLSARGNRRPDGPMRPREGHAATARVFGGCAPYGRRIGAAVSGMAGSAPPRHPTDCRHLAAARQTPAARGSPRRAQPA